MTILTAIGLAVYRKARMRGDIESLRDRFGIVKTSTRDSIDELRLYIDMRVDGLASRVCTAMDSQDHVVQKCEKMLQHVEVTCSEKIASLKETIVKVDHLEDEIKKRDEILERHTAHIEQNTKSIQSLEKMSGKLDSIDENVNTILTALIKS